MVFDLEVRRAAEKWWGEQASAALRSDKDGKTLGIGPIQLLLARLVMRGH